MDIPVSPRERTELGLSVPTELEQLCEQLCSAMGRCPELSALLWPCLFDDKSQLRPGLIAFHGKAINDALSLQLVISDRLREIADAATRLAEWVPGEPSGLQKSEALRLLIDLTSPKEPASAAARIERAVSRHMRYR